MEKNECYLKLNIDLVELPTLSSRAKLLTVLYSGGSK